jgi:hypothetical protein
MNDGVKYSFIDRFNSDIQEAEVFLFATRGTELQSDAIDHVKKLCEVARTLKEKAIQQKDENQANLLLGYECVFECLIQELQMWIFLKEDEGDKAWDGLVRAQMSARAAARAHQGFEHLAEHHRRLEAIENLVFPPQVFLSSGMLVKHQECSICGTEYEDCDHLIGKPYMGKFCHVIGRDLEINHVAIVEQPADKCCRVLHFDVEGGVRNRMTWRIESKGDT